MAKTITIRVDDATYDKIRAAADSERRTISNFIENAALSYVDSCSFIADEEMNENATDKELIETLKRSLEEVRGGRYRIVE